MDKYPPQLSKASNKDKYLISKKLLEECFASLMSNHQMEYEGSPMSYEERIQQLTHELETLKQINNDLLEEIKNVKKQSLEVSLIKSNTDKILDLLLNGNINIDVDSNNQPQITTEQLGKALPIKGLQHEIHLDNIHSNSIYTLIQLADKRIATGGKDCSISISSINFESKKWRQDIKKTNAHDGYVWTLCELPNNRLISGGIDKKIKIWTFSKYDMNLTRFFTNHTESICHIIRLRDNRFASCAYDKTIRIWKSEEPYDEIKKITQTDSVYNLLEMKKRDVLISSCKDQSLYFWNSNTYGKEGIVKDVYAWTPKHMIELSNESIAISSSIDPYPIVIVNPFKHTKTHYIKEKGYIKYYSSLSLFDNCSFIYAYSGKLVQVSIKDNSVVYKTNIEKQIDGWGGVVTIEYAGKKYLVITSVNYGLIVVKPTFD